MMIAAPATAQIGADINLSPKRVVIDGRSLSGTVFVFNRGTGEATYRIELIDRVMMPDGQIQPVSEVQADPKAAPSMARFKSATPLLTYTPRRVALGANQSQAVRVRASRPADLAPGEYRSFLTVTGLPPESAGLTADQVAATSQSQLSIKLIPMFSISIPVLVRVGPVDVRAAMSDLRVGGDSNRRELAFTLKRAGTSSLFGDVEVHRGSEKGELIGRIKGIGVYTEVDARPLAVALEKTISSGERLVLVFRDDDTRSGTILAAETLTVP
jgi:hypothetical protein